MAKLIDLEPPNSLNDARLMLARAARSLVHARTMTTAISTAKCLSDALVDARGAVARLERYTD